VEGATVAATRDDWTATPLPERRATIALDRTYSASEFERLKEGFVPGMMEDKWFVFYEGAWLYMHRSWTGFCEYQVRFEPAADGARVVEVLANRDPAQYRETDDTFDALGLAALLDEFAGRPSGAAWEAWEQYFLASRGSDHDRAEPGTAPDQGGSR
jgi:hypothetical protein